MKPVPWRSVQSWRCVFCGLCCRDYQVVLGFNEWISLLKNYGSESVKPGLGKLFISKKSDGSCYFSTKLGDTYICGLQHTKPKACKIWPFKIHSSPKYGRPVEAHYRYRNKNFFIYVDPLCTGLSWGIPNQEFIFRILPEFVEVAIGVRDKQFHSTSKFLRQPSYYPSIGRRLF